MNRDELLSSINNDIQYGSNPQNTDFDSAISNAMIDSRDNGSDSDERSFLIISFCEMDDTCNIQNNIDPEGDADIEIFVLDGDTLSTDPFSCLLPKRSTDNSSIYSLP